MLWGLSGAGLGYGQVVATSSVDVAEIVSFVVPDDSVEPAVTFLASVLFDYV